ncbi:MAG: acyl-CoA dehydrogenase family protein [Novosphingobium sp.]
MLDERWSEDVEEIADVVAKMLGAESTSERVRKAEAEGNGIDPELVAQLEAFGLEGLEGEPELFARIALELGKALASVAFVETMPVLALTGRPGVSLGFSGPVPAANPLVAARDGDVVRIETLNGEARPSAAGDSLVEHHPTGEGEVIGDAALADRLQRFADLVDAARLVGAGKALLAYGVDYVGQREQFGRIIATYQGVSHRMSRVAGDLDAADLLVRKAAFAASTANGGDGAPPPHFAIMVRAKAIQAARLAATNVHQVFGGNGFAMEYDVQLYSRRIRSWVMRGRRSGPDLAELGRMVLDPARRDSMAMLWHHEQGIELPRWAKEADRV